VMNALIACGVIALASTILSDLILNAAIHGLTFKNHVGPSATSVLHMIVGSIADSLLFVGFVLALAYGLAFFMPKSFGDMNTRFYRALTPVALIGVCVAITSLIYSVVSAFLYVPFGKAYATYTSIPFNSSGSTTAPLTPAQSAAQGPVLGLSCISILLLIGFVAYAITAFVQAGAVGSNLSRWMTFFILAGTFVAYYLVNNVVQLPLMRI